MIKKNLEAATPLLHEVFLKAHRSQLRNAIAHSQYAVLGREIWLHNHNEKKVGYVGGISFDEWIDIFHETIVIFTLYNRFFNNVKEHYYQLTKPVRLEQEVRVQRLYPTYHGYPIVLYSRECFKDWSPYPNL